MEKHTETEYYPYIILGGGIAGVTCAETLSVVHPEKDVLLLTASELVKAVTNFKKVSRALEEFDVVEKPMFDFAATCPNVTVKQGTVKEINVQNKIVVTSEDKCFSYEKLCICTGGTPKMIAEDNPHVIGIRDTETVKVFQHKLENAKRILVVGNGGIATEIVYEIEGCEVVWAIKDESITHTFVDAGAAKFFLPQLCKDKTPSGGPVKRLKYTVKDDVVTSKEKSQGSALGPDWSVGLDMHGKGQNSHNIHVEYKVEIVRIMDLKEFKESGKSITPFHTSSGDEQQNESWQVYVELTNGKLYGCDFVVSATGVIPNVNPFFKNNKFHVMEDGGLKVNSKMETSEPDVYAAGDVCTASWDPASHWVQMRLWSQARQMGSYAAKCMAASMKNEDVHMDFCFELFAHVTKFFNYKVVLLGRFNAQGLGNDYELLLRVTEGLEYVKVVMKDGQMQGCVLIGETDLEETFENLILNQMDLSVYGEDLLDPNIDIEDYFD